MIHSAAAEMDRIAAQHGVETLAITADVRIETQVVELVSRVFSTWVPNQLRKI